MSTIEIARLNARDKGNIVEVLFTAFENYPLMQFFFGDAYQNLARYFWGYICDVAPIIDAILLGAFIEGKLQGFAFVLPPKQAKEDFEKVIDRLKEQLTTAIGEEVVGRIDAYVNFQDKNKPLQPHFYLDLLSVHPQSQGKGVGKALLSQVHAMSEQHPQSCGVGLETQTEQNVGYYERFGYGVYAIAPLNNVKTWFMFRYN